MIIYLKSGQTIDMGDVTYVMNENNDMYKPWKYCEEDEPVLTILNTGTDDEVYLFYNANNEKLEVKRSEIVGIREEVE